MSMIRPGGGSMGDSGDPYDGYDRFGRVQEMRWQSSSSGTPIDAWQWGYNEASNRTWKKNLVATSGQDEAYGYDDLYQVIRDAVGTLNTNRTAIGGVPVEEEDFTYDPTGNWLGYRKDANGSAVLDQSRLNNKDNQLTQIDGSSALLSYDRAGNATKTAPGVGGDWGKSSHVIWDAWNCIVEVKDENWTSVQKNAYDGLSRRITKEAASVVTHTYWSDRWKPLEERTGSATTAARSYLWGERPGHRDELILRDRDTNGDGSLDERLYGTMDYFNGTAVLNTSGVVQERYAYSAFGARRIMAADFTPRSSSSFAWDFGFQGQFRDVETGWSNYGYRFYVPMLGRWINRDPIGERGGVNLYRISKNMIINFVDVLGLQEAGMMFGDPEIYILTIQDHFLRRSMNQHLALQTDIYDIA
jgi:RHS repeat-associated protein